MILLIVGALGFGVICGFCWGYLVCLLGIRRQKRWSS